MKPNMLLLPKGGRKSNQESSLVIQVPGCKQKGGQCNGMTITIHPHKQKPSYTNKKTLQPLFQQKNTHKRAGAFKPQEFFGPEQESTTSFDRHKKFRIDSQQTFIRQYTDSVQISAHSSMKLTDRKPSKTEDSSPMQTYRSRQIEAKKIDIGKNAFGKVGRNQDSVPIFESKALIPTESRYLERTTSGLSTESDQSGFTEEYDHYPLHYQPKAKQSSQKYRPSESYDAGTVKNTCDNIDFGGMNDIPDISSCKKRQSTQETSINLVKNLSSHQSEPLFIQLMEKGLKKSKDMKHLKNQIEELEGKVKRIKKENKILLSNSVHAKFFSVK